MNRKFVLSAILFLMVIATGSLMANGRRDDSYGYGRRGYGHMGPGMGGYGGGMMGYGYYNGYGTPEGERLSHDEVESLLESYVEGTFGKDYFVQDLMEFQWNYYAQVGEEGADHLAVELLVDPYTGRVGPEPGPNMMWNLSYGHMRPRFWTNTKSTVTPQDAVKIAQEYLDYYSTGLTADEDVDAFDGYYTLHTLHNGDIAGMLSVNSVTGDVWYHNWHGQPLGDSEHHDE